MSKCRLGSYFLVFVSVISFVVAITSVSFASDAKGLFESTCSRCHSLGVVSTKKNLSSAEWSATINKMKNVGLAITPENQQMIADYLAKTMK